ncbi:MAG: Gfo/Idh/MocA family oxidoreductase [Planctomycetota bacterium]
MSRSLSQQISRRKFSAIAAAATVGAMSNQASTASAQRVYGANEKVNVAIIGCGGMGASDANSVYNTKLVNVVALCDVALGTKHTASIEKKFPDVPRFKDFRAMFDKMSDQIDACTIGVPDHSHFPIAMLAMSLGKGVYVEKPLAHTFQEIELMMAAEKKYKVACQMGNQGHSGKNYHQFKAWKEAGVIKNVRKVNAYMNSGRRWHPWEFDEWQTGETMPAGIDWDTWTGTAAMHPYSNKLHPGNWRSWFDYGNGAFGDWGPHLLDTVHRFLNLGMPEKVTAVKLEGRRKLIFPMGSTIQFDFPQRGDEPPCVVTWYDGVKNKPPRPDELAADQKLGNNGKTIFGEGLTFKGASHGSPLSIIPTEKAKDMAKDLPEYGGGSGHHLNFIRGVKGEEQTRSSFDISGPLSQMFCLGVIAQRLGGDLEFDRETKQITNNKAANDLLVGPPPRKGWEQFYAL